MTVSRLSPPDLWAWLHRRLIAPPRELRDSALRRNSELLATVVLALIPVFVCVDAAYLLNVPGYQPPWYGYAFLVLIYAFNRTRHYRIASTLLVSMFPVVVFSHIAFNDAANPIVTLGFLATSPIVGALFVSTAGVSILSAVNILGILALPILAPSLFPTFDTLIGPLSMNTLSAAVAILFMFHRNQIEADRQRQLAISEERLRQAVSAAKMGTWEWVFESDEMNVSPRLEEIFGMPEGSWKEGFETYRKMVSPDDRSTVDAEVRRVRQGEVPRLFIEHRVVRNDGSVRWVEARAKVFERDDRSSKRMIGTAVDVTERRELNERIKQSERIQSLGLLAGGVAHDFNNMLVAILGSASLLDSKLEAEPDMQRMAKLIVEAAENAASLTRKLLDFSRRGKSESAPLDINECVAVSTDILRHSIDRKIVIETRCAEMPGVVVGDPTQLKNVILNLALNARDAMPTGGKLQIWTKPTSLDAQYCQASEFAIEPGQYAEIGVSDTGIGMADEIKGLIFDPFFTTKDAGEGTGLGLASVYGSVTDHAGAVQVDSELGCGTTVRIYLPLSQRKAVLAAPEAQSHQRERARILVIDDESIVRITTCLLLKDMQFDVESAEDGEKAKEIINAQERSFDLVVLDLVLPNATGREVLATLKEMDAGVRVLLSSGFSRGESIESLLDDPNVVGFLQKPYSRKQLGESINRALNR